MALIGTFTLTKDGGWTGSVQTLTINAKLRLVPNDNRTGDSAPAFRVFLGQSHIGDAWEARSGGENPRNYLRVKLDDPGLSERLAAALYPSVDGSMAQLVWNRPKVVKAND